MQQFCCSSCWCRYASFLCKSKEIFSWRSLLSTKNFFFFFFWTCVVCPLSSCLELTLLLEIFSRIWKYFSCLEQTHQDILDRICGARFCMTAIYHTYPTEIHEVTMVFPSPLKNDGLFNDTHINFCYRSGVAARWHIQDPCRQGMNEWQYGSEKLRTIYKRTW
jgi:hypothetical protein